MRMEGIGLLSVSTPKIVVFRCHMYLHCNLLTKVEALVILIDISLTQLYKNKTEHRKDCFLFILRSLNNTIVGQTAVKI